MYYLRTRGAADAIKFTVDSAAVQKKMDDKARAALEAQLACSLANKDACEACSG